MRKSFKKFWKYFFIGFTFLGIVGGASTYFVLKYWTKPQEIKKETTKYSVSIEGAVLNPGDYEFDKPQTVREIIFKANVRTIADISSMDLENIINKDTQIFVPFQIGTIDKIEWSKLSSIEQLVTRGIKKDIAKKILEFRRQNSNPTWEQIHAIKGIGQKTLEQLKNIIELS